ncbi:MAG: ECF transporter S component [Micrococcales bacterium]
MRFTSRTVVGLVALISISMFTWPLFVSVASAQQQFLAQTVFLLLMPALLAIAIVELASGQLNSRQIAVLGVLIALNSVVRMLGAGTAGIETVFFLILIAGYGLGPGFGYLMGTGSLLVSAVLTGGVGPWLPFQMMAAGLLGFGAGLLPKSRSRWLRATILGVAAVIGSFAYGALMTMWNWPYLVGNGTSISYQPGAPITENLWRFLQFELATGGLIWDAGRAVTTLALVLLTAPALLTTLERVARRAEIRVYD